MGKTHRELFGGLEIEIGYCYFRKRRSAKGL